MSRVDDMTMLHDQIKAGRNGRRNLVAELARANVALRMRVAAVRMENSVANKERSRSLMVSLSAFMANLSVNENARQQAAAQSRSARVAFVDSVAQRVASLARDGASSKKAHRAENAASRASWRGVAMSSKRGGKAASSAA